MIEILKEEQSRLTLGTIDALGAIGRDAGEAAVWLSKYLQVEDERLQISAACALAHILPGDATELKPAIPVLVKALHSKHRPLRNEAVQGLMSIGTSAVPELARFIENFEKDPQSAAAAATVLQMLGTQSLPALPALIRALASRHEQVVIQAADALGAIGPSAKDALPELQKLLQSEHPLSRTHAAHNLGLLGPNGGPAVSDLAVALKDKDVNVRREAAGALGEIGPLAKVAVPELIAALNDEQSVAVKAAHALGRVGEVLHARCPRARW